MEAAERTFGQLRAEQVRYVIPPNQLPYSREKGNVEQLLEGVWEAYEANHVEYFIGTLVAIDRQKHGRCDIVGAPKLQIIENLDAIDAFLARTARVEALSKYLLPMVYVFSLTTTSWQSTYRRLNVLNARSMALLNVDLIKNMLLARLRSAEAHRAEFDKARLTLEELIGSERLNQLLGQAL